MANRSSKAKSISTEETPAVMTMSVEQGESDVTEETTNLTEEEQVEGGGTEETPNETVPGDTEDGAGTDNPIVDSEEEPPVEGNDENIPLTPLEPSEPVPDVPDPDESIPWTPLEPSNKVPDEGHHVPGSTDVFVFTGNVKIPNNIDKKLAHKNVEFTRTDDDRLKVITTNDEEVINDTIKDLSRKGFKVTLEQSAE